MGIPLCVICCFSLSAFNSSYLCLIFVNLINMCLGLFRLGCILIGTLWVSWTWVAISFPILGKFSAIISSSNFSWPFFLSSSRTPMIRMLGHFTLSQRQDAFLDRSLKQVANSVFPCTSEPLHGIASQSVL